MMRPRARRACKQCGGTFQPRSKAQILCGLACVRAWNSRRLKGRTHPALQAAKEARLAIVKADLLATFGELSTRDLAIFRWAYQRGWRVGYQKSEAKNRRAQRQEAA